MSTDSTATRRTAVTLLGALTLAATLLTTTAPAVQGADACRVRNVTQDTHGTSFIAMVAVAVDGDRLTVRGTCEGGVVVGVDIAIRGMGDRRAMLDARGHGRVLRVEKDAAVTFRHVVVTGGRADYAAGIFNRGSLTLTDSVVRGNTARDGVGGGLWSYGTLTLIDSVVRHNTADAFGGGIYNLAAMTLTDSVVRHNTARYRGGGLVNLGRATLTGSVVRDNTAGRGGGVWNAASLTLRRSSSVTANTASRAGGGIWNDDNPAYDSTVILRGGSSVTSNTPDDCYGTTAC